MPGWIGRQREEPTTSEFRIEFTNETFPDVKILRSKNGEYSFCYNNRTLVDLWEKRTFNTKMAADESITSLIAFVDSSETRNGETSCTLCENSETSWKNGFDHFAEIHWNDMSIPMTKSASKV